MRIAYLISAYLAPQALVNLVAALDAPDTDFYLHIDKKVDQTPFAAAVAAFPNVHFVAEKDRVRVNWGGYSQIEMQLAMLDLMFAAGKAYDRVVNLSGTDYPVLPRQDWYAMLADAETEYIIGFDIASENFSSSNGVSRNPQVNKYRTYHFMDANIWVRRVTERLRIPKPRKYHLERYRFYFGSEYWALSYGCIKYLVESYKRDAALQNILRCSYVPSEIWLHTLFFASPYAAKAAGRRESVYRGLQDLSPLSYFQYSDRIKVLTEADLDAVLAAGKPFARKLLPGPSDGLIDLLRARSAT